PASVPGGDGGRDRAATDLPGAGRALQVERQGAARPGDDLPEVLAKAGRTALRQRRGAGRGSQALPGGTADPGSARDLGRAVVALVPTQTCGGGPGSNGVRPGWVNPWRGLVAGTTAGRGASAVGTAGGLGGAGHGVRSGVS